MNTHEKLSALIEADRAASDLVSRVYGIILDDVIWRLAFVGDNAYVGVEDQRTGTARWKYRVDDCRGSSRIEIADPPATDMTDHDEHYRRLLQANFVDRCYDLQEARETYDDHAGAILKDYWRPVAGFGWLFELIRMTPSGGKKDKKGHLVTETSFVAASYREGLSYLQFGFEGGHRLTSHETARGTGFPETITEWVSFSCERPNGKEYIVFAYPPLRWPNDPR
jgi:hypothetical protein